MSAPVPTPPVKHTATPIPSPNPAGKSMPVPQVSNTVRLAAYAPGGAYEPLPWVRRELAKRANAPDLTDILARAADANAGDGKRTVIAPHERVEVTMGGGGGGGDRRLLYGLLAGAAIPPLLYGGKKLYDHLTADRDE